MYHIFCNRISERGPLLQGWLLVPLLAAFGVFGSFGQEHRPKIESVEEGLAQLSFVASSNFFHRLETTSDLSIPFTPASAWIKGNDQLISTPIYAKAPKPVIPQETESFTIYSFTNGQSLIVLQNTNITFGAALVAQDFRSLPPFYFHPPSTNGGPLLLHLGELQWNIGYSNYNFYALPPEEAASVLRLTSRYQEITNVLAQGGPIGWPHYGAGLPLSGEQLFFRVSRFPADQDEDALDWASEIFLTGTDPLESDSNHNGVPDGLEDQDADHIPNADEIQFGLNPLLNETSTSTYSQHFTYDSLHRLRTVSSPGSAFWTLTLDAQGNITRAGQ